MDTSSSEEIVVNMEDSSGSDKSITCEDYVLKLTDATAETFNPLIALYAADTKVLKTQAAAEAPIYLNVLEFQKAVPDPTKVPVKESSLKPKVAKSSQLKTASSALKSPCPKSSLPSSSAPTSVIGRNPDGKLEENDKKEEPFYPIPGRKFLPHQLPVFRPRKEMPTVLTGMETVQGPMSVLREAIKKKTRLKVWTRGNKGIRGVCVGIVHAFDSHWNLAMGDVEELFQRKREIGKSEAAGNHPVAMSRKSTSDRSRFKTDWKLFENKCILVDSNDALKTLRAIISPSGNLHSSQLQTADGKATEMTKAQVRKKGLVFLRNSEKDVFGFDVIARSQHYEIVRRYQRNYFLMGNEVAFIESSGS